MPLVYRQDEKKQRFYRMLELISTPFFCVGVECGGSQLLIDILILIDIYFIFMLIYIAYLWRMICISLYLGDLQVVPASVFFRRRDQFSSPLWKLLDKNVR